MLKLSVNDIVKHNENCYSFVMAIAKRARQISDSAYNEGEPMEEKPVQVAVEEFVEGKFRISDKQPDFSHEDDYRGGDESGTPAA
jgi:DNA-directed RNA polymerase subunit omega